MPAGCGGLRALGVHTAPIGLSSTNPVPGPDAGGLSCEAMAIGGHPAAEGGTV